jgi:hypothetical protein
VTATRHAEPSELEPVGRVYFGAPRVPADIAELASRCPSFIAPGGRVVEWDGEDDGEDTVRPCSHCGDELAEVYDERGRCLSCIDLEAAGAPAREEEPLS